MYINLWNSALTVVRERIGVSGWRRRVGVETVVIIGDGARSAGGAPFLADGALLEEHLLARSRNLRVLLYETNTIGKLTSNSQ